MIAKNPKNIAEIGVEAYDKVRCPQCNAWHVVFNCVHVAGGIIDYKNEKQYITCYHNRSIEEGLHYLVGVKGFPVGSFAAKNHQPQKS